ncbi:GNAT family N-acetyltransferase [Petropleomorpha daqingensis]|uniref:Putative GNAT superfamily acetyltransferase n=1 Tax=Petropleomorpha daqingensis TaxID=2026353 RepID=A0A853C802_9ACTN|nr:GNAT family N-acetyltransferase [Petropleomorpha daqingensis]NYJ04130.1 putative GNAT superfamily acetyltransferase [Petropleomorpha daqingensis]
MTSDDALPTMGSVTDRNPTRLRDDVDAAEAAARAAALAAGVTIRELTELPDLEAVSRLFEGIWGRDAHPPMTTELLRALAKAGNYVVGAFDGGTLVGACAGFFSAPAQGTLHSHIAGVSSQVRGRSVGFAVKVHQRAWALHRDVPLIGWTFDPLVRRNAWFNLGKLAAAPVEYLPNFYGGMHDGINGDDDSDRLLVHWDLRSASVAEACRGRVPRVDAAAELAAGAVVALGATPLGTPQPGSLDGAVSLVAVPPDIEGLRTADPGLAKEWRVAVREALVPLLASGASITGFDRSGWFVVQRQEGIA